MLLRLRTAFRAPALLTRLLASLHLQGMHKGHHTLTNFTQTGKMADIEAGKKAAAWAAVDEAVKVINLSVTVVINLSVTV